MSNELNLYPPANFDFYWQRKNLIAKRNAEQDQIKREQINLLLEQLEECAKIDPRNSREDAERKAGLAANIERQMKLMAD